MILPDTSIWISHFRSENELLTKLLRTKSILAHPLVIAELAMGSLRDRTNTLSTLDRLPQVRSAYLGEVRRLVEDRALYRRGISAIDAHLLASVLIDPPALLWTADKRLMQIATDLRVHVDFPEAIIH